MANQPATGSPAAPVRRPWTRRPGFWILLALLAGSVWLVVSIAMTAVHAKRAEAALSAIPSQVTGNDPAAATASIQTARLNVEAVHAATSSLPISMLATIPYFRTNLHGVQAFTRAALSVLDAADATKDVYPTLMGEGGQGEAAFQDGVINVALLKQMQPQVRSASANIAAADRYLNEVPPDVSPVLRRLVNKASAEVAPVRKALLVAEQTLPELPTLMGERRAAKYLVVFNNPAELYPGGGASLNVALVEFKNGRMSVLDRGDVYHFFPGVQKVPWNPVAGGPYFEEKGAEDGFAWSNLHQDFRVAGEDVMRSWVANGGTPVDGVISLDPVALAAAIDATGPIDSKLYGTITAKNLVRKLLFLGYRKAPVSQDLRHEFNQELIDEMLSRMRNGDTALNTVRAMLATAPGQHIRVYLSNGRLASALHAAQLDGAQPDPQPDRIAFYTQNQNASKVDIFQNRRILQKVRLAPDGSAEIVQTARVKNGARQHAGPGVRIGYNTGWAFHWNIVLLPEGARDVRISANPGQIKKDDRVFTDVDGREAVRIGRWIPPGGTSVITTSYSLPPGTFGSAGDLEYTVGVEHQLTVKDVKVTIEVAGPSRPTAVQGQWTIDGNDATARFPVTGPTTLSLSFAGTD